MAPSLAFWLVVDHHWIDQCNLFLIDHVTILPLQAQWRHVFHQPKNTITVELGQRRYYRLHHDLKNKGVIGQLTLSNPISMTMGPRIFFELERDLNYRESLILYEFLSWEEQCLLAYCNYMKSRRCDSACSGKKGFYLNLKFFPQGWETCCSLIRVLIQGNTGFKRV